MKRLKFATTIRSTPEKVWNILWDDITYRKWTSVFSEGSYAVSNWNEGDSIQFLSPSGDGMYSVIAEKRPNEFMSFKHLGVMKNGEKVPPNEETEKWAGALENYTLKPSGDSTALTVEIDISEDHEGYFEETFPKALEKIKSLTEIS